MTPSRLKAFRNGLSYLRQGFTTLLGTPKLWPWAIIPTLINLLLLGVAVAVFSHFFGDLYQWLVTRLGLEGFEHVVAWWQYLLNGLLWMLNLILKLFILLLALVLILVCCYGISFIVAGPFNDLLSEKVEYLLTGREEPPFHFKKFLRDLWRTIKVETVKAIILLAIPLVFFVLSFIPLVGGPLYTLLTLVFGSWDMGFAYAELSLGRRVAGFAERKAFALKHRWTLVGLGAGFLIPFFNLLFAAPLAVGGTILFVREELSTEQNIQPRASAT